MFFSLLGIGLLAIGLIIPIGEAIEERDWPRDTFKMGFWCVVFGVMCLSMVL